MKPLRTRSKHMHSSFVTRKGLVWTVHAGILASRASTRLPTYERYNRPSRVLPSDRLCFPRLQLRGSAGFSPASLLVSADEGANQRSCERTKLNGWRNLLVYGGESQRGWRRCEQQAPSRLRATLTGGLPVSR